MCIRDSSPPAPGFPSTKPEGWRAKPNSSRWYSAANPSPSIWDETPGSSTNTNEQPWPNETADAPSRVATGHPTGAKPIMPATPGHTEEPPTSKTASSSATSTTTPSTTTAGPSDSKTATHQYPLDS